MFGQQADQPYYFTHKSGLHLLDYTRQVKYVCRITQKQSDEVSSQRRHFFEPLTQKSAVNPIKRNDPLFTYKSEKA